MLECKNCKYYVGDCGHHFKDSNDHTDYDIPRESACDKYGNCIAYAENRSALDIALEALQNSDIGSINISVIMQAIKGNEE